MEDNKEFDEKLKENIQEEFDNENKKEDPSVDKEVEEVSEEIKADEKVIDFEELKALKEENNMFKNKTNILFPITLLSTKFLSCKLLNIFITSLSNTFFFTLYFLSNSATISSIVFLPLTNFKIS